MKITWDKKKDKLNILKHNICFETAARVFLDENRIEFYDDIHSLNEDRYITIGRVHEIIMVVYTVRKSKIRMISARVATRREREWYYEENY